MFYLCDKPMKCRKMAAWKPELTLKQFIRRQQVLSLFRDLLRATRGIENTRERKELRVWVRSEFDKWKDTKDEDTVKMLLSRGRMSLRELQTSIESTK